MVGEPDGAQAPVDGGVAPRPPGVVLRNVIVGAAVAEPNNLPVGGVVWPRDAPDWVHQRRYGEVTTAGSFDPGPPTAVIERACYAGYATAHFGHFVLEQAPRVLDASRYEPQGSFLLVARPARYGRATAPFVYEVLHWFGVAADRVRAVESDTTLVKELVVFPSPEEPGLAPSERYLDVLDDNTSRNRLSPISNDVVYVSRSGVRHHASGESYLDDVLAKSGVTVVHPETMSVREQLAHYQGARTLVFSEGSAMHGRQLLGRADQRIAVLQRRKGGSFGREYLVPRCSDFRIVDALHCSIPLSFRFDTSGPKMWEAFPLLDGGAILEAFDALGVDLRARWDSDRFDDIVEADLSEWARWMVAAYSAEDPEPRIALALDALESSGQQHLSRVILQAFAR